MKKKIITLTEPRAENSARACSDCLALTELTLLGVPKCLQGVKVGPARRVTLLVQQPHPDF